MRSGCAGSSRPAATSAGPAFLRMLTEVPRFHRRARALLEQPVGASGDQTLRDFLADGGFSAYFCRQFMEPLVAAVWSCDPEVALDYPARYLFEFLAHHGMLVGHRLAPVAHRRRRLPCVRRARRGRARRGPARHQGDLGPRDGRRRRGDRRQRRHHGVRRGRRRHPPRPGARACCRTRRPSSARRSPRCPYADNLALLHTDTSLLPRAEKARASWNFLRPRGDAGRGHGHLRPDPAPAAADDDPLPRHPRRRGPRRPEHRRRAHGVRPPDVQPRRPSPPSDACPRPTRDRLAFAGAYHGWGFHEDGARSGAAAAEHLGLSWDGPTLPEPGLYDATIRHTRRRPFQKRVRAPVARLAGRPRRPARPRPPRPLRGPRPPRLPRCHDPGERRRLPGHARRRRRPAAGS